jgi:uncharacterized protein
MRHKNFGERHIVRLESGECAVERLMELAATEHIGFANVSAAGVVNWVRLAYWNAATKKYEEREFDEQLEVVSFQGNSSLKDGKPFFHVHGVFTRQDFSAIAGHIQEVRVHPTLEVWPRAEDVSIRRVHEPTSGLDLLDLPSA